VLGPLRSPTPQSESVQFDPSPPALTRNTNTGLGGLRTCDAMKASMHAVGTLAQPASECAVETQERQDERYCASLPGRIGQLLHCCTLHQSPLNRCACRRYRIRSKHQTHNRQPQPRKYLANAIRSQTEASPHLLFRLVAARRQHGSRPVLFNRWHRQV